MNYKQFCVVGNDKIYKEFVMVEIDEEGSQSIIGYKLSEGDILIEANPPTKKINALSSGFIVPKWDESQKIWVEGATPEQIAEWEGQNPVDLEGIKASRIAKSKTDLQTYLANNPLQWTDGKYYTITAEKQQQLTSKLLSATFAKQTGTEYDLKWNDTEQVCVSWTLENLTALAFAIDARVTALVTYQQEKERQIRDAETLETLESIVVNYDEVV